jgi:glycerol-3-phosphate acyltransferase PlsX
VKIAVDAMGGDHAPSEIVRGAVLAASNDYDIEVILVGREDQIENELAVCSCGKERITIVNTSQVIQMNEHPVSALRRKKDSSIRVAAEMVASGEADALVSMGNTGATMGASLLIIGRIPGISRPALAMPMPTLQEFSLVLDCGATVDCKPSNLLQFAVMGSLYLEKVFGRKNPTVGLLNIGEEKTKGNELVRAAFPLLEGSKLNFVGNIEANELLNGTVDVIVCDGFTGNVILKFAEGFGAGMISMIKDAVMKSPFTKLGGLFLKGAFRSIKKRMDYAEYGGVPLLGVNGVSIIGHGRSNATAVSNAINVAKRAVEWNVVAGIGNNISESGVSDE